jgi:hypothetical protein
MAAISGAMSTRAVGGTESQATRPEIDTAMAAWPP